MVGNKELFPEFVPDESQKNKCVILYQAVEDNSALKAFATKSSVDIYSRFT